MSEPSAVLLWQAGLERRCPSIRTIDIDVLDCEDEAADVFEPFIAEAKRAITEDHAEASILGCALRARPPRFSCWHWPAHAHRRRIPIPRIPFA